MRIAQYVLLPHKADRLQHGSTINKALTEEEQIIVLLLSYMYSS